MIMSANKNKCKTQWQVALLLSLGLLQTAVAQTDLTGKGVEAHFTDPVKTAKSSEWLQQLPQYQKNGIIYYDAEAVPAVGLRSDQKIDTQRWCNYDKNVVKKWKKKWDQEYRGKVTAGCASLYLDWQKARACQKNPDLNAQWQPNTQWKGQGQSQKDLPNGSIDGLLKVKKCVDCQLNLVGLSCLNLSNIDFSNSVLTRMDFYQADLSGANFSTTQLTESVLTASNLTKANMTGIKIAKSVLSNAILEDANLSHSLLANVDLQRANLKNANFSHSTLRNVSLSNADLRGANFDGAILENVDLTGAQLGKTQGLYLRRSK